MRARKAQLEKWFELVHCWTDPGFANDDSPVQDSKGYFPTKGIAHGIASEQNLGSELHSQEFSDFLDRIGKRNGYRIIEHLVVLEPGRKTFGRIVSSDVIRLTTSK